MVDDGVADLSDQDNESRWSVVVLGVGPDKQNSMHNWNEQLSDVIQILSSISQLIEEIGQGLKVLEVLVGFSSGCVHFLLQLAERTSVGGFVLLQELQDLLDSFRAQLGADGVQVFALVLPEI